MRYQLISVDSCQRLGLMAEMPVERMVRCLSMDAIKGIKMRWIQKMHHYSIHPIASVMCPLASLYANFYGLLFSRMGRSVTTMTFLGHNRKQVTSDTDIGRMLALSTEHPAYTLALTLHIENSLCLSFRRQNLSPFLLWVWRLAAW